LRKQGIFKNVAAKRKLCLPLAELALRYHRETSFATPKLKGKDEY